MSDAESPDLENRGDSRRPGSQNAATLQPDAANIGASIALALKIIRLLWREICDE
jgi:hypothetical protein